MKIPAIVGAIGVLVIILIGWQVAMRTDKEISTVPTVDRTTTTEIQPRDPPPTKETANQTQEQRTISPRSLHPESDRILEIREEAANLAMEGTHEEAARTILRAVVLSESPDLLYAFINTWYAETGKERIGLPLLMVAQRMGVDWADDQIRVFSRKFNEEELAEMEGKAVRLEEEFWRMKQEITRGQQS